MCVFPSQFWNNIDKSRLVKKLGQASENTSLAVSLTLVEMFSI